MDILRNQAVQYANKTVLAFQSNSPEASGKLRSSFTSRVVVFAGGLQIEVYGESYAKFVNEGRKAGLAPQVASIEEWLQNKGIQPYEGQSIRDAAYFIAAKIGSKGTPAKKFIEDYLEKNEALFADRALIAYGDDIQLLLVNETKNLK